MVITVEIPVVVLCAVCAIIGTIIGVVASMLLSSVK